MTWFRGRYIHLNRQTHEQLVSLVRALVVREFKGQYRRSLLGPAWAFLQPMAYMVVFIFLRGVLNIPSDEGVPYALFTFVALVPWTFMSNAVIRCAPSVYANAPILKKSAVPREIFPLASMLTSFIDFLIAALILSLMLIWYQHPVGWTLLWIPLLALLTGLLALGLGLGLAAIGTFKRDVIFAIPFGMQFWLLATPIMYPANQVPERWRSLFDLNPMVGITESFRSVLLHNQSPDLTLLGGSALTIAVIWLIAWPLFRSVSQYFADVL
ncbi:ABC-2 type transporter [Magnetococcus marinus MC-1]|uniref:Transport permease protein n=1 Tax=Magnetococcus marinus (strain ATCC BAA-1437 / JCM 17883 / MC-1) TaxID=156889 RepID=A0L554_MAGMM|nr:ABC transporter permease [Magnetococcus marinus]ABK43097.1 ABC-2 type transporter [Magnetococcus marinus MC-1]